MVIIHNGRFSGHCDDAICLSDCDNLFPIFMLAKFVVLPEEQKYPVQVYGYGRNDGFSHNHFRAVK